MLAHFLRCVAATGRAVVQALRRCLVAAAKPASPALILEAVTELVRTKPELVAENALLRQQLLVLRRSVKRPRCRPAERALLVLLASRIRAWRQALAPPAVSLALAAEIPGTPHRAKREGVRRHDRLDP